MDKSLKIGFLVFAIFAVLFGVIQISQTIRITNNTGDSTEQDRQEYTSALEDAKMRVLDTDEDGLSDWQETNVYGTSLYLADTDSDGINDAQEIARGTDPNCAEGKICGSGIIGAVEEAQSSFAEAMEDEYKTDALIVDFSEDSQAAMAALEQGTVPTPAQIRALLRDSGISEEQVDLATDEELLQLFQEVSEQTN
ncbi:thrombospondin type 3 repeat-containing protein [Patescibacteria group bacterium]|nr:thrombospondin type 3 repeat-containing protein [Patescibacteria group bacterium]